jgi:2'-5' RNA ligase
MSKEGRSSEGSRRLFFALWPSEAQQQAIEHRLKERVGASGGRAIPARNLHVTLIFLGNVPDSQFEITKACAAQATGEIAFDLTFDRLETWSRSRVLCLAASAVPQVLAQLVERLQFNLLRQGFEIRQEEFRPHVTLARDVKKRGIQEAIPAFQWQVEHFVLVESQRGPAGSQYTIAARWPMRRAG